MKTDLDFPCVGIVGHMGHWGRWWGVLLSVNSFTFEIKCSHIVQGRKVQFLIFLCIFQRSNEEQSKIMINMITSST